MKTLAGLLIGLGLVTSARTLPAASDTVPAEQFANLTAKVAADPTTAAQRIMTLEHAVEMTKADIDHEKEQNAVLRRMVEQRQDDMEKRLQEFDRLYTQAADKLETLRKSLDLQVKQRTEAQESLNQKIREIGNLETQLRKATDELATARRDADQRIAAVEKSLKDAGRADMATLSAENRKLVKQMETDRQRHAKEMDAAREREQDLLAKIRKLELALRKRQPTPPPDPPPTPVVNPEYADLLKRLAELQSVYQSASTNATALRQQLIEELRRTR